MDNSEIIIYIIVISIVFISAIAKKRNVESNEQGKTKGNNSTDNSSEKSITETHTSSQQYNWNDNYNNSKIEEMDQPPPTQEAAKVDIPLNTPEELRKAVILSEILKRKF